MSRATQVADSSGNKQTFILSGNRWKQGYNRFEERTELFLRWALIVLAALGALALGALAAAANLPWWVVILAAMLGAVGLIALFLLAARPVIRLMWDRWRRGIRG